MRRRNFFRIRKGQFWTGQCLSRWIIVVPSTRDQRYFENAAILIGPGNNCDLRPNIDHPENNLSTCGHINHRSLRAILSQIVKCNNPWRISSLQHQFSKTFHFHFHFQKKADSIPWLRKSSTKVELTLIGTALVDNPDFWRRRMD